MPVSKVIHDVKMRPGWVDGQEFMGKQVLSRDGPVRAKSGIIKISSEELLIPTDICPKYLEMVPKSKAGREPGPRP